MLNLRRREGQVTTITVPPSAVPRVVQVHPCKIEHGQVSLAFAADRDILIERDDRLPRPVAAVAVPPAPRSDRP